MKRSLHSGISICCRSTAILIPEFPPILHPESKLQKKKKQYVRFILKEGSPSKLLIMMDQEKDASVSGSSAAAKPQQNPEQLKMATNIMKEFLKGMRVFMAVDIDGSMLGTNATHQKRKENYPDGCGF